MGAMSIDVLLPAFPEMRKEFGLEAGSPRISLVITAFLIGMALGQILFGPASDRFGRKPVLMVGLLVFVAGGLLAAFSSGLTMMIVGRLVWGIGTAAPRSILVAMVRDICSGEEMARVMSTVMAVFILVPVFAPALGSALLTFAPWRIVLWIPILGAVLLLGWISQIPETLRPEHRRSVGLASLSEALSSVVRSRQTVAYGLAQVFLFGIMASYIGGSENQVNDVLQREGQFALIFGVIAASLGVSALVSARIVERLGLHRLIRFGAAWMVFTGSVMLIVVLVTNGRPSVWAYVGCLVLFMPSVAVLNPNCNTAAMMPVAHVAGMASAVLGTVATAGGSIIGAISNRAFDGTMTPFAIQAFVVACLAAASVFLLPNRKPAAKS